MADKLSLHLIILKDTDKWARNIIKLMSGDTSNFETLGDSSLFGADVLAETFKDTFDTFKAGLGIKDAEPEKSFNQV